jgi:hypothetical protein
VTGKKKQSGKNGPMSPMSASPTRSGGSSHVSSLPKTVDLVVPKRQMSGVVEEGVVCGIAEAVGIEVERNVYIGDDVELTFEDAFQI